MMFVKMCVIIICYQYEGQTLLSIPPGPLALLEYLHLHNLFSVGAELLLYFERLLLLQSSRQLG